MLSLPKPFTKSRKRCVGYGQLAGKCLGEAKEGSDYCEYCNKLNLDDAKAILRDFGTIIKTWLSL